MTTPYLPSDIPEVVIWRMAMYGASPELIANKAVQYYHSIDSARGHVFQLLNGAVDLANVLQETYNEIR